MRATKENQKSLTTRRKSPGSGNDSHCLFPMPPSMGNITGRRSLYSRGSSAGRIDTKHRSIAPPKRVYTCNDCEQPIEGVVVEALGQTWHPDHFTCTDCKKPITEDKFYSNEGKPYCEEDYAMRFFTKCASCEQPITDVVVSALNQNWHRNHFLCNSCGIVIPSSGFFEKDNSPYCRLCYEKAFMPKCQECQMPITYTAVMTLGEKWHQSCFKCQVCGKPTTDCGFQILHNRPMCIECCSQNK